MLSIYYYPDTTFKKSITKIYTSALNISNYAGLRFVTFHAGDIIRLNTVELLRLTVIVQFKCENKQGVLFQTVKSLFC